LRVTSPFWSVVNFTFSSTPLPFISRSQHQAASPHPGACERKKGSCAGDFSTALKIAYS
jgi:hypothetical protein